MIDLSGSVLLNLGCGYKTCDGEGVVNVDYGVFQRLAVSRVLRRVAPILIGPSRAQKLNRITPGRLVVYDISRGIPAAENSVGAVYHSHMLEHLDRDVAVDFMREVRRVLKPGGIQRIAVPDLEQSVRSYLAHLDSDEGAEKHDEYVTDLLEQSVRREASGTSVQRQPRRFIENLLLGDARRRGETHQWMYDRMNLSHLLSHTGFTNIQACSFGESAIPKWASYGLELDDFGREYKPRTLYMEGTA
ncbi:methyltransferase domain-containing protein [Mycolicibacterium sp. P1-5]|uniref:class I SAM-dependent methyltransferase n=1 Tax=Mycolicibacterium sp. P1-5 TaxID=2024617 RepID=UPI0011F08B5F|nr:methyltransferase domain-containing protein [Mycolicibacterium sp. P1-5]KAA0110331.1 methyltransferase domain-containing protein [Mycolicibacterium sp. P1-5]